MPPVCGISHLSYQSLADFSCLSDHLKIIRGMTRAVVFRLPVAGKWPSVWYIKANATLQVTGSAKNRRGHLRRYFNLEPLTLYNTIPTMHLALQPAMDKLAFVYSFVYNTSKLPIVQCIWKTSEGCHSELVDNQRAENTHHRHSKRIEWTILDDVLVLQWTWTLGSEWRWDLPCTQKYNWNHDSVYWEASLFPSHKTDLVAVAIRVPKIGVTLSKYLHECAY